MIDLRSDTVTKPSPAMRKAIFEAEVGDDVLGDDPTVKRLEEKVAELLGKEAALFLCSGTQANQVALAVHGGPGSEIIVEEQSHIFNYEGGATAVIGGAQLWPLRGEAGVLRVAQLEAALRPDDPHFAQTRLVCMENTHNDAGGRVLPLEGMRAIADFCGAHGIAVHLDGARLMNAVVASGLNPAQYAATADTATLCLSKGLGAPIGTCLAGEQATIDEARWWRKRLGGGMRQVGILAAAGLYALANNVSRLAEDHANARRLAAGISELPHLDVRPDEVDTNIVLIHIDPAGPLADELAIALEHEGVFLLSNGPRVLRAVTHLDVDTPAIDTAIAVFRRMLAN